MAERPFSGLIMGMDEGGESWLRVGQEGKPPFCGRYVVEMSAPTMETIYKYACLVAGVAREEMRDG